MDHLFFNMFPRASQRSFKPSKPEVLLNITRKFNCYSTGIRILLHYKDN